MKSLLAVLVVLGLFAAAIPQSAEATGFRFRRGVNVRVNNGFGNNVNVRVNRGFFRNNVNVRVFDNRNDVFVVPRQQVFVVPQQPVLVPSGFYYGAPSVQFSAPVQVGGCAGFFR